MSAHMYDTTYGGIMGWARAELEHVGRIVSVQDRDLQYSYALSVVNSMAHLKDALFQMVADPAYKDRKQDLLTVHGQVIRTMQHLVRDFHINVGTIRAFNTRHVLGPLTYLKRRKTRRTRR